MGVRFYDKENMSNGANSTTATHKSCNCDTCNLVPSSATTTTETSSASEPHTTNNSNNGNRNFQRSGNLREIVGNCKEMRIEINVHNLRIVGNNNRIRIKLNRGDIIIIGNNTRLKIKINHGVIKYTGNNGSISLGKDSTEQFVDYSGCNGVLKVQSSKKSSQVTADDDNDVGLNNNSTMGSTHLNEKLSGSKNQKYASFSGSPSNSEWFNCHNNFIRKTSMPNITTKSLHSDDVSSKHAHHSLPSSIVPNFGSIVIANSSNICISPYTYTY